MVKGHLIEAAASTYAFAAAPVRNFNYLPVSPLSERS